MFEKTGVNKAKTPTNQAKGGPRKRKRRRNQAWGLSGVRGFVAVDLERGLGLAATPAIATPEPDGPALVF